MTYRPSNRHPGTTRRGAAAVELAILLPFLIFMFLVAIDFCRVYYYTQTLQGCARNAALYASRTMYANSGTSPEDAARQAALAEGVSLNPPLRPEDITVTSSSDSVTVEIRYPIPTIATYPGVASDLVLSRTVTIRKAPLLPGQSGW